MKLMLVISVLIIIFGSHYVNAYSQEPGPLNAGIDKDTVFAALQSKILSLNRNTGAATSGTPTARAQTNEERRSTPLPKQPNKQQTATTGQDGQRVSKLVEESNRLVTYLKDLSKTRTVPTIYLENLQLNAALLDTIQDPDNLQESDIVLIETVASDLRVKGQFADSRAKLGGDPFGLINIKVYTKKDGNEVSGCDVWYVPAGWADDPSKPKSFDRQSSPTDKSLPPSNYLVWARKDRKTGEKKPVTVGDDGKTEREIDILAP